MKDSRKDRYNWNGNDVKIVKKGKPASTNNNKSNKK